MVLATAQKPNQAVEGVNTRWFRVQLGGYEQIETPEGEPMAPKFVLDGFNIKIEVPNTSLGLDTRDRIEAEALRRFPNKEKLVDFWPLSTPPADEF